MSIKTADLCDASSEVQHCALYFQSFGKRRHFSGTIRTVRYLDGFGIVRELVHQNGQGQVLVVDGCGAANGALFGDVMASIAISNGWEGIVVNGAIRDSMEIETMDIGVKALGTLPNRANLDGPGQSDVSVTFGGLTFTPGHRLVADDDGVVVLPMGITENDLDIASTTLATARYDTKLE